MRRKRNIGLRYRAFPVAAAFVLLWLQPKSQFAEGPFFVGTAAIAGAGQATESSASSPFADGQLLSIQTPAQGNRLVGEDVEFSIKVSTSANLSSLQVDLNGNSIANRFHASSCTSAYCIETAQISSSLGLMNGKNGLTVTVDGPNGDGDSARVRFDWNEAGGTQAARSLPPSVTFQTIHPGGGNPWFRIAGRTFPAPTDRYCQNDPVQVIDLDRYELTEKAYRCFKDAASLSTYLQQMTTNDLVIAGTTGNDYTVFARLNTTAIGGTDYTNTSEFPLLRYPGWYMIVGVGGAPSGQAYEAYSVRYAAAQPFLYRPLATGMLSEDSKYAYNFHSSDRRVFQIIPNDSRYNATSIEVGRQTYTSGQQTDCFWVLMLDRVSLQPIDSSMFEPGKSPCKYEATLNEGTCGRFFHTGSSDSGTAARAINEMASLLSENEYRRNLIFIATRGTALTSRARPSEGLFRQVDALGGSGYLLMKLASTSLQNQTYSLVSAHDHGYHTAVGGKAAFSTSLLTQQGQTGRLRGLLTQDHFALFSPMEFAQDSAELAAKGDQSDFSFEQVVMATPAPWPYSDSPGHMAAYRFLSYELVHSYLEQPSGDHLDDIRYYYTGSQNVTIANGVKDPASFPYPGDGHGFTAQQWADMGQQLKTEKGFLRQLINFFGNATEGKGMGGVIAGSGSSITLSLLAAANEVKSSTLNPSVNAHFSLGASGTLRLVQGLLQIGQGFTGPFAPAVGLVGGLFNVSATLAGGMQPGTIPNPEYAFTTTLAQLTNNTSMYLDNMRSSFNTSLDSIYSDWYKLETAGRKVVQTGQGGWYYDTQASYGANIRDLMNKAMQREAYLQLTRLYYGVDYWPNIAAPSYDKIGSVEIVPGAAAHCSAFYKDNKTPAIAASSYDTATGKDILVIAGEITNNNNYKVKEKNVPEALLNTFFGNNSSQLNLPRDLFLARPGPLPRRDGPKYGSGSLCNIK